IALEYVEGTSLDAMLCDTPRLDPAQAIEIMLQICAALGSAHAAGIVHRDLKPANVLIEKPSVPDSGSGRGALPGRVVDFGLAKVVQGEPRITGLTEAGMIFGTPEYMAPEQVRGEEVDHRSDLYSAGVILYQMVVGEVPFKRKSAILTMTAHITD